MPRPKLKKEQKKVPFAFRVDPKLFDKFEKQRKKYNRTKTYWGELAFQHYVEWVDKHPLN